MEELARAMEAPPAKVKVLMVPLPAQSHLNQLLHLARLVVERGIPVHYAAPAAHIRQARLRVHGWAADDGAMHLLHFHDVPFPDIPSPPPDPNNPHKFPAHLQPLFDAAEPTLSRPLADIVRSLAAVTDHLAVVHDVLMSFVAHEVLSFIISFLLFSFLFVFFLKIFSLKSLATFLFIYLFIYKKSIKKYDVI